MNLAVGLVAFAPALTLGSFLNVVATRLPRGGSIVRGRSVCPQCHTTIRARDNVPLLSYVLLRRRCRHCSRPIALRYPAVELATAALVALSIARFGLTGRGLVAAFFTAVLVVLSAIDIEHRILPNKIVLPATVVVLAAQSALAPALVPESVLAAFGASLFLFVALLAYPAGMGMGDVKLALLLGAALGKTVAVALMLGMLAALVAAVVLLVRHGAAARKMAIPFGPFLALGSVVALFAGDRLMSAYLGLF
ncbi:MAG: prepilin peptidase [Actinomycetota bacterium]|nr:prepilin peptidase [Actinomycetota bacterium]